MRQQLCGLFQHAEHATRGSQRHTTDGGNVWKILRRVRLGVVPREMDAPDQVGASARRNHQGIAFEIALRGPADGAASHASCAAVGRRRVGTHWNFFVDYTLFLYERKKNICV